jgi:hypothetical protein
MKSGTDVLPSSSSENSALTIDNCSRYAVGFVIQVKGCLQSGNIYKFTKFIFHTTPQTFGKCNEKDSKTGWLFSMKIVTISVIKQATSMESQLSVFMGIL